MLANQEPIVPWRPADWLRLLRWMLATPEKVVAYEATANNRDKRRLRQTAALLASILAFVPLIILIFYASGRSDVIGRLNNLFGFISVLQPHWLVQNWILMAMLLLIGALIGASLSPWLEPSNLSARAKLLLRLVALLILGFPLGWLIMFGLGPLFSALLLSDGAIIALLLGLILGLTLSLSLLLSSEAGFLLFGQLGGLTYGAAMMAITLPFIVDPFSPQPYGLFAAYVIPFVSCLFIVTLPIRRYGAAKRRYAEASKRLTIVGLSHTFC